MTTTPTTDAEVHKAITSFKTLSFKEKVDMKKLYRRLRDNGADIQEAYIETLRRQIEP